MGICWTQQRTVQQKPEKLTSFHTFFVLRYQEQHRYWKNKLCQLQAQFYMKYKSYEILPHRFNKPTNLMENANSTLMFSEYNRHMYLLRVLIHMQTSICFM